MFVGGKNALWCHDWLIIGNLEEPVLTDILSSGISPMLIESRTELE